MFYHDRQEFAEVIGKCTTEDFLKKVCSKYHYLPEDMEQMKQVSSAMQEIIREEASWQHTFLEEMGTLLDGVVMTLGQGIDHLQDSYSSKGDLSSAYMTEVLSGEILLLAYVAYNQYMAGTTPYYVARYYFLGSEEKFPLTMLPKLLSDMRSSVTCNESFCMIPKQSVAFLAQLTEEKDVQCAGICMDCTRKDCPNRSGGERLLPYGYARIFGKELL